MEKQGEKGKYTERSVVGETIRQRRREGKKGDELHKKRRES